MSQSDSVRARLIKAALESFLADDFHNVTTRAIAEKANTNISMIRYYFGNKVGLYEEMIRDTMLPLLDVLDSKMLSNLNGFGEFIRLYYTTMNHKPEFTKLILKVLALNQGPGRRIFQQILERGRTRNMSLVDALKKDGIMDNTVDHDVMRIAFVSLAMTPMLLKGVFEEQMGYEMDDKFLDKLAEFNGRMFSLGMSPEKIV